MYFNCKLNFRDNRNVKTAVRVGNYGGKSIIFHQTCCTELESKLSRKNFTTLNGSKGCNFNTVTGSKGCNFNTVNGSKGCNFNTVNGSKGCNFNTVTCSKGVTLIL